MVKLLLLLFAFPLRLRLLILLLLLRLCLSLRCGLGSFGLLSLRSLLVELLCLPARLQQQDFFFKENEGVLTFISAALAFEHLSTDEGQN